MNDCNTICNTLATNENVQFKNVDIIGSCFNLHANGSVHWDNVHLYNCGDRRLVVTTHAASMKVRNSIVLSSWKVTATRIIFEDCHFEEAPLVVQTTHAFVSRSRFVRNSTVSFLEMPSVATVSDSFFWNNCAGPKAASRDLLFLDPFLHPNISTISTIIIHNNVFKWNRTSKTLLWPALYFPKKVGHEIHVSENIVVAPEVKCPTPGDLSIDGLQPCRNRCPAGYVVLPETSYCTPCKVNYKMKNATACEPCPAGESTNGKTGYSDTALH